MTVDNNLNEEELKAIDELRQRFKKDDLDPKMYDDIYVFLRFLRARDMDLDKAEIMLRKHLDWRKQQNIDSILNFKKPEIVTKYFGNNILGFDKEGSIVRYLPEGNIDVSGILSSCTREDLAKSVLYDIEFEVAEHKKQSAKLGRNIDQTVYIHDLNNFSFAVATDKRVVQFGINILNQYIYNYPERLKAAYIINVPVFFSIIYSVLKSLLPATVLKKLHIYSDDSYKQDLLKIMDADQLPKFLGGNKTDPDGNPLCLSFINHGGEKVPESLYFSKNKVPLSKIKGIKKVTLSRAAFHEVMLEVKEPGSYLEWEFETKCRDIGFGLFYQEVIDGEEKITEIVGIQRIDTEHYPETGTYICENAGTYVIVFDNTYSWVRAKEIYYRTKVVTPKEHEAEIKG